MCGSNRTESQKGSHYDRQKQHQQHESAGRHSYSQSQSQSHGHGYGYSHGYGYGSGSARTPSSLEACLRRGGVEEAWALLEGMQGEGGAASAADKFTVAQMMSKTVCDSRGLNPAQIYRGLDLAEGFIDARPSDADEALFNALLDACCRLKDVRRLEATLQRMRELGVQPTAVTLGILVKAYGQVGDLNRVLGVWEDMAEQREQANSVTYGCMLDACVKCGDLRKAKDLFRDIKKVGRHRNTVLYTTLIKGHGIQRDLQSALALFREMKGEGVPYNTITYNSIIDVCIKCGAVEVAEGLVKQMTASDTEPSARAEPDLITFSTLLKGYCHTGEIDKALQVFERIGERGLRRDELVYNTLLDGCVKIGDLATGLGLFEEMINAGMKPSMVTHSILIRLYRQTGYGPQAVDAVAQLYRHHGLPMPLGGEKVRSSGHRGRRWSAQQQARESWHGSCGGPSSKPGSPPLSPESTATMCPAPSTPSTMCTTPSAISTPTSQSCSWVVAGNFGEHDSTPMGAAGAGAGAGAGNYYYGMPGDHSPLHVQGLEALSGAGTGAGSEAWGGSGSGSGTATIPSSPNSTPRRQQVPCLTPGSLLVFGPYAVPPPPAPVAAPEPQKEIIRI